MIAQLELILSIAIAIAALAIAVIGMRRTRTFANRLSEVDLKITSLKDSLARLQTERIRQPSVTTQVGPTFSAQEVSRDPIIKSRGYPLQGEGMTMIDSGITSGNSEPEPPTDAVADSLQSSTAKAIPEALEADYSGEAVRKLYRDWCRDGRRPASTSNIEIASLQYDRQVDGPEGKKRHLLKEAPQLAEFVRFSPKNEGTGVVLPDLDAHFTPVVAYIFPGISRADYAQSERLKEQQPVTIKRYSPSQWEAI